MTCNTVLSGPVLWSSTVERYQYTVASLDFEPREGRRYPGFLADLASDAGAYFLSPYPPPTRSTLYNAMELNCFI